MSHASSLREAARGRVLTVVQTSLRVFLRRLSPVVPTTRRVVVSAVPDSEGNGVETAAALLRRYDGLVVWLAERSDPGQRVRELEAQGMRVVPKTSRLGLWHYLRAETVFFTHGLYGSPRPSRRKPVVNLWHGDGPKDVRPTTALSALIASTFLVGNTELWSRDQADALGVPASGVLVTGNPRTDQFWRPPAPERLAAVGASRPFVLWMPTFRQTRATGAVRVWNETQGRSEGERSALRVRTRKTLASLAQALDERGMQLLVKAHHMDADAHDVAGAVSVTNTQLETHGVGLYELIGQSAGLVTDFSSVWVDYLLLDRPLAFWIPDRHSYDRPLVPPDVLDWLPGESADLSECPFEAFLADLDSGGSHSRTARVAVANRIGLNPTRRAADDLLDALTQRRVVRGLRTD